MSTAITPKPSILMIGNYLSTTRWNKNVWHYLAEKLSASGWTVLTTSSKEKKIPRLFDMLWTIWSKRGAYSIAQIDVFSGSAFLFAALSTFLLRLIKKNFVLTLHGGRLPEFSLQHAYWVSKVLNLADTVVTPSPFIQNKLKVLRSDIYMIPNPIDLKASIFRIRKHPKPHIIWVRAFHEVYNPAMGPKTLSLLLDYPDVHLTMLGPDKGDGSLEHAKSVAHQFAIDQKIDFVGGVAHKDVTAWLDKADIFINTTNYDTAPRSLIEAMGNGLCIVSTNVGGVPYIVEDGHEGLLVPPGDEDAMANAIRRIVNDPVLAERLSINARLKAEQMDWSTIFPQWEELFSELAEPRLDDGEIRV